MTVLSKFLQIRSKGEDDIIDLTKHTAKVVLESKLTDGIVTVFVVGSTAAITTIEFERGLAKDFPEMLSRVAPKEIYYEHEKMWQDGNGHSHVRASLIGPSLTVPFKDGGLILGTWQQIVLVEMDTRYRERKVSDYRGIIRDSSSSLYLSSPATTAMS
jgi:secondary thiamine-phosphate synthase enzyme